MYRRVMLTTDGSSLARAALPHAATIAGATGARVDLVAVVDSVEEIRVEGYDRGWIDLGGTLSAAESEEVYREQVALATAHLEDLESELSARGIANVTRHVVTGRATEAIVDAAGDFATDLIVMGTHGRSGASRALLGSVADHVARHAPCPVLLVRSEPPT
jgi:nucleotide-binding universal stress UspA family protein